MTECVKVSIHKETEQMDVYVYNRKERARERDREERMSMVDVIENIKVKTN